jgi:hypothetical protein
MSLLPIIGLVLYFMIGRSSPDWPLLDRVMNHYL